MRWSYLRRSSCSQGMVRRGWDSDIQGSNEHTSTYRLCHMIRPIRPHGIRAVAPNNAIDIQNQTGFLLRLYDPNFKDAAPDRRLSIIFQTEKAGNANQIAVPTTTPIEKRPTNAAVTPAAKIHMTNTTASACSRRLVSSLASSVTTSFDQSSSSSR